ncbi:MAG: acetylxylan esterase [Candidatus Lokiarchaeota archaeon]|nr:acetylxylan esterase [Candidatus Lokiarchaeota archaeon]
MVSLKDKFYIWGQKRRFKGKGEPDLRKIKKKINNLEDWKKRSAIIRNGILKGANLLPIPKKTPLNPVIHSRREYGKYSVESVYLESIPGFYVTGSLYQPLPHNKDAQSKSKSRPILLKPHGHRKNKRFIPDNQNLCSTLARMGVVVFTYDMIGYADSQQVKHHIKSACTLQTWNSTRSLDFILSLPNVDPSRVGMAGGSGGGTQTFLLTAIDDRITASAPIVMVSSFFFGGCICESGLPIHKGPKYATNNAEIAALAAPRPQLLVSVGTDWTRLTPIKEYPFIRSIYDLYGAGNRVENIHLPNEKHNLGYSKRQAIYDFYNRIFGLNIDDMKNEKGEIDESENVIEEVAKLRVFNEEYKLPENALKSEEQIIESLKKMQIQ